MKGYKWLTSGMKSSHGNITWKLNEWQIHKGELKLCQSGFHASKTAFDSLHYICGDKLVEIEAEDIIEDNDKFVSSKMRVVKELPAKKIMLKFAIECAKRVLYNFEKSYPNDNRPREAIKLAENILMGVIPSSTDAGVISAAYAATHVARSAEYVAIDVVDTTKLTTYATIYALRSAADAAKSAAYVLRSATNIEDVIESAVDVAACAVNSAVDAVDAADVVELTAYVAARPATNTTRLGLYLSEYTRIYATRSEGELAGERKWQSEKLQEIIEEYTVNK